MASLKVITLLALVAVWLDSAASVPVLPVQQDVPVAAEPEVPLAAADDLEAAGQHFGNFGGFGHGHSHHGNGFAGTPFGLGLVGNGYGHHHHQGFGNFHHGIYPLA